MLADSPCFPAGPKMLQTEQASQIPELCAVWPNECSQASGFSFLFFFFQALGLLDRHDPIPCRITESICQASNQLTAQSLVSASRKLC